ncbi:MAG: hypothetical protein WBE71_24475 [Xanthobacteraceae bacterium]
MAARCATVAQAAGAKSFKYYYSKFCRGLWSLGLNPPPSISTVAQNT